jgi:hypothetical protein
LVKKTLLLALSLIAAGSLALVACSDDDDPSSEEATTAFCSDLTELGTALSAYGDLTVDSTIEEVEDAQADVADAYNAVIDSAGDVTEARVDDLESAFDDLASSVDDISGEDTVGEAITTIATQAEAVEDARADLVSSAGCV